MAQNLKNIKAIAYDIDGVMTNGGVLCTQDGDLLRTYDSKDSFAVRMATMHGFPVAVITGGASRTIVLRAKMFGVKEEDVYLSSRNKIKDFNDFISRHGLDASEVMYFGDDLPDVPVLKACGRGVAPADACEEAKAAADVVSEYPGGHWCVRKAIEEVMKAQDKWYFDVDAYEKTFK